VWHGVTVLELLLVFPNVEELVGTYLSGRSELTGTPVVATLPGDYDGKAATVLLTRVGGVYLDDDRLDRALLRIDAYGPDKTAAHRLALAVRGLMWAMPVSGIAEERGPHWLPDAPHQHAARYMARYQLTIPVTG
jgi:hypothetical protein